MVRRREHSRCLREPLISSSSLHPQLCTSNATMVGIVDHWGARLEYNSSVFAIKKTISSIKTDQYAGLITLFFLVHGGCLRGALHRRIASRRQLRGKGAAALVAGVFVDEVFLVQLRLFRGHDRQRGSVRLSRRRVDDFAAGLGDRTRLQRSMACRLVHSL